MSFSFNIKYLLNSCYHLEIHSLKYYQPIFEFVHQYHHRHKGKYQFQLNQNDSLYLSNFCRLHIHKFYYQLCTYIYIYSYPPTTAFAKAGAAPGTTAGVELVFLGSKCFTAWRQLRSACPLSPLPSVVRASMPAVCQPSNP